MPLRPAILNDLDIVTSWVTSARECALWTGPDVSFPIDIEALRGAIDFDFVKTFSMIEGDELVAFGQIVPKGTRRGHLARLIVAREQRRRGYGRALVGALVEEARAAGHESVSLNVDPSNGGAIALYESLGFRSAPRPDDEPDPAGSRYMEMRL
ncbi:MAG: GNAT family N-acetyltransferase [Vicinamibacterales bacterium]